MDLGSREWEKLTFYDPEQILVSLRRIEYGIAALPPARIRVSNRALRLRSQGFKPDREARDAALFAHGMAAAVGTKVFFAPVEESDYDFVTVWIHDEVRRFTPVQLKELHPTDVAPNQDVSRLLANLDRYVSTDTVLAIYLNRAGRFDFRTLEIPSVPFAEMWFFWCSSVDQSKWMLYGDMLGSPRGHPFAYPSLLSN